MGFGRPKLLEKALRAFILRGSELIYALGAANDGMTAPKWWIPMRVFLQNSSLFLGTLGGHQKGTNHVGSILRSARVVLSMPSCFLAPKNAPIWLWCQMSSLLVPKH